MIRHHNRWLFDAWSQTVISYRASNSHPTVNQEPNRHQLGSGIKQSSVGIRHQMGIKQSSVGIRHQNSHQLGSGIKQASVGIRHQTGIKRHQIVIKRHQRVMNYMYARKKKHKSTIIHSKCSILKYKYNPGCFLYSIVALKTCLNKNVKSWVLLILFTSNVFNK